MAAGDFMHMVACSLSVGTKQKAKLMLLTLVLVRIKFRLVKVGGKDGM